VDQFENYLSDGVYYVGAYLDVNFNGDYDPAVDPGGLYGMGNEITPVTIADGSDGINIDVYIEDPDMTVSRSSAWRAGNTDGGKADARLLRLRQLFENAARQVGEKQ
jgi:hypothetical protein